MEKAVSLLIVLENWIPIHRRVKLETLSHIILKISSIWVKDSNVRSQMIKLFENNIGETLHDIGLDKFFSDKTPKYSQKKQN
jgi:hypothetical protein